MAHYDPDFVKREAMFYDVHNSKRFNFVILTLNKARTMRKAANDYPSKLITIS